MNELLACAITGFVALAIGIPLGMSLQWRRDEAYIGRLEGNEPIRKDSAVIRTMSEEVVPKGFRE